MSHYVSSFFFFNDTATTEIYTLSLHDALPISGPATAAPRRSSTSAVSPRLRATCPWKPNRSRSRRAWQVGRPATPAKRKARFRGLFLFDLCFLVDDVFARPGVVLLHLDLVGRGALVLGGRVEVAGARRGFELDFLAHCRSS